MHRLNRARALTFLALRNGDFDRLVDALPILSDVVQDPDLDPAVAMIAGRDLIEAHSLLVQHGGDPSRYGDSIELFARLVDENPGIPGARSLLHEQRAGYQQCVLSAAIQELTDATSAGDQDRAEHACERIGEAWYAVERELRTALRLVAAGAEIIPEYLIMLVSTYALPLSCSMRTALTRGSACAVRRFRRDQAGRASKSREASFI